MRSHASFGFARLGFALLLAVALGAGCPKPAPVQDAAATDSSSSTSSSSSSTSSSGSTRALTPAEVPALCQAQGERVCREALSSLGLAPREWQAVLDGIEAEARRGCRTWDGPDCDIADSIAYVGRRDLLVAGLPRPELTTEEAAVLARCENGERAACATAGLAAMNAFDDPGAGAALDRGCNAGDAMQCWTRFVLVEDSYGLAPASPFVAAACAQGDRDACAVIEWVKQTPPLLDAAARALPPDAVVGMAGVKRKAFPAGGPLFLDERVLVREVDYGDGTREPQTAFVRLRVGSMAGDDIRFAGRSGRVVTWNVLNGSVFVRERQVLGVLNHPWTKQIAAVSPLVPKRTRADSL